MGTMLRNLLKIISLLGFIFIVHCAFGQGKVLFLLPKMNLLYSGVGNEIATYCNFNEERDSIVLTSSNATVVQLSEGLWEINPEELGDCVIFFYENEEKIDSALFRVVQVPEPSIRLLRVHHHIPARDPSEFDALFAFPPTDFPYDIRYEVISFSLKISDKEGNCSAVYTNSGEAFSDSLKNQLKAMVNNISFIEVSEILIKYPNGSILNVKPIKFSF